MTRPATTAVIATTALAACLLLSAAAHAAPGAPARAHPAVPPPVRTLSRPPRMANQNAALARDTLAWVGRRAITALDLVQRIEWMPWPGKDAGANMDSVKSRALRSLVAEALLAGESERRSATGGADLARLRQALRKVLARDALYRELADAAAPPSAAEVTALAHRMHPGVSPGQLAAWRHEAADSLRELAGQRRAAEFLVAHLAGHTVKVDSATFVMLADTLCNAMAAAHLPEVLGGGTVVPSEAPDLLLNRFAPVLELPLAQLPDGPFSLGDALEDMRFYLFVVHSLRPGRFAVELAGQFRLVVENEIMAREALRRHLDEQPEAAHDLQVWTDYWRAQDVLATVADIAPVGDDEAFRSFAITDPERARAVSEVDVEEILCASREEADQVRAALGAGARFDSLAARRTRRTEWAAHGGRSGFFPVRLHLELGYAALLAPLDSLLGPIRLPEGFSIYRVRGKRLEADSLQAREALERARSVATAERRSDLTARYVASLAAGVNIRFADAALSRVDILRSNMVVRRSLGFGGGMTAAPTLTPIWEWTRYWSGARTALP